MLRINKSVTENQLIAGCKKGKPAAQHQLYERLAPKMMGVCVRYISDRGEAEHVMVGSIVKVFDKIGQYKGEGNFEGWVRRIVVNDCLMYLRKNSVMSKEIDLDEAHQEPNLSVQEDKLEEEDLIQLINQLPAGYKAVFNLYAIEGYSHKEIAQQLNISENTSKSQLSRARKWLQNQLEKLDKETEESCANISGK